MHRYSDSDSDDEIVIPPKKRANVIPLSNAAQSLHPSFLSKAQREKVTEYHYCLMLFLI